VAPTRTPGRIPGAATLQAHPVPTVVTDAALRVICANVAARRLLGAREGVLLGDAIGCVDAGAPGGCGTAARCGECVFQRAVKRALAGETVRERGFVLRGEGAPHGDLHLLACVGPFDHGGAPHAILALQDLNAILGDPGLLRVCGGCGRIEDEEGGWHPLHRYLEDQLGVEAGGPLCPECERGRR
jgi:hypothetical protein